MKQKTIKMKSPVQLQGIERKLDRIIRLLELLQIQADRKASTVQQQFNTISEEVNYELQ